MQTRFRVYDRLGAERGQLPNPLEAIWVPPLNSVPTLTIHYSLLDVKSEFLNDAPEVAFEYWDPETDGWVEPLNGRFKFFEEDFDHLEDTPTKMYTFLGVGEALLGQTVYERYGRDLTERGRVSFPETNAGEIMSSVWDNAESRGWTGFEYDFTATHDSNGQPWAQTFNISYETKTDLAHILDGLVRQGACDYAWEGRTLHLYNAHTYLAREMSTGDTPILFNLSGGPAGVDGAPEQVNTENLATHVIVLGENNLRWVFPTGAILPEGRREVVLEYGGVNDEGTARILADPVILKAVSPLMNTTRQFHLTDETKIKPLINYRIGDWCLVERESEYQRMQIVSMSIWVNQNGVHGYVTLGDKIDDTLEKMYEAIQGLTGGIANEGVGAPPVPNNRTPSIPTNLLVTAEAYPGQGGLPTGLVGVSFVHPFTDTLGDPINLDHFEIQMKEVVTAPETRVWQVGARIYAPATAGTISSVPIYNNRGEVAEYDFRAYAISDDGRRSGSSAIMRLTMVEDSVPPPIPSTPVVTAQGVTFTITSDGLGSVGESMPRDYSTSPVEMGTSETGPWESVGMITRQGALTIVAEPDATGSRYYTRWFRMRSVDATGNFSDYSGVDSATTSALVPQSVFDDAVSGINEDLGAHTGQLTELAATSEQLVLDAQDALEQAELDRQAAIDAAAAAKQQAIEAAALEAQTIADQAEADAILAAANAAAAEYTRLEGLANTAQEAAEKAEADALAAAGLAADQGKVWPQPTEPPAGTTYDWLGEPYKSQSVQIVGGTENRRNHAVEPCPISLTQYVNSWELTQRWHGSGSTGTTAPVLNAVDGPIPQIRSYLRKTWDTVNASQDVSFSIGHGYIPATPGEVITLSFWVRGSWDYATGPLAYRNDIRVAVYDAAKAAIGTALQSDSFTGIPVGEWYRYSFTFTVPDGAAFVGNAYHGLFCATHPATGDTLDATGLLVEKTDVVQSYFDGSTPDDRQNDLWVDTDGGNTPHTWDPINHVWAPSTDQNVIDAANAASAAESAAEAAAGNASTAQQNAQAAQSAAETAQGEASASATAATNAKNAADQAAADAEAAKNAADAAAQDAANSLAEANTAADNAASSAAAALAAQQTASGKTTVSTLAPTVNDLANKPASSMWTQVVGGKVIGAWYKATETSTSWTTMPFDPVMIPQINIGTGTFGELDGIRLKAKSVATKHLFVGGYENLIPGAKGETLTSPFTGMALSPGNTAPGVSVVASHHAGPATRQANEHIEKWFFNRNRNHQVSVHTLAAAAGSRFSVIVTFWDRNLTFLGSSYVIFDEEMPTVWTKHTRDQLLVSYPSNAVFMGFRLHSNVATGIATDQYFANPMIREMEAGELIVEGSIKATKIDTNDLTADTGFISNLRTNFLYSDVFEGKAFNGGTFTGTTFQSHVEALKGLKITADGIVAYTPTGAEGIRIYSASGTGRFAGRVSTATGESAGSTLLPSSESTSGSASGLFISQTSTLEGGVTAGAWIANTVTNNPELLNLRGMNGGGVYVLGNQLRMVTTAEGMGDFASYAIKPNPNVSYLWQLQLSGGYLRIDNAPTTSAGANALIAVTPAGVVYRSTSSMHRKADIQPFEPEDPYAVLNWKGSSWIDRNPMDPTMPNRRYIGYIAEWMHEVAPEIVTYNEWDEPDAVQYDRMPSPYILPLLRDVVSRIEALEQKGEPV